MISPERAKRERDQLHYRLHRATGFPYMSRVRRSKRAELGHFILRMTVALVAFVLHLSITSYFTVRARRG